MEQAAGREKRKAGDLQKDGASRPFPSGGQVDEVVDGMAAAGGLRAGWHICSTRTTGQTTNPSTPKQQDEIFADVFHSVTENGPKLPMTLSDKMMQLQDQNGKPICSLTTLTNYGKVQLLRPSGGENWCHLS